MMLYLFIASIHLLVPTLVGLCLALYYGVDGPVRFTWCAIEIPVKALVPKRMGGQTSGFVIMYRSDLSEKSTVRLRPHERTHVLQYVIFGIVFYLLYFGHSAVLKSLRGMGYDVDEYRDNIFERWARWWGD